MARNLSPFASGQPFAWHLSSLAKLAFSHQMIHICCRLWCSLLGPLFDVDTPEQTTRHLVLSDQRASALAKRIRELRASSGLSQTDLAESAGITRVHMGRIERATGNPTLASLYAIADTLGVKASTLLPD